MLQNKDLYKYNGEFIDKVADIDKNSYEFGFVAYLNNFRNFIERELLERKLFQNSKDENKNKDENK